jgi:scyllo-inositol 2-dehydrogenase (NADP+)
MINVGFAGFGVAGRILHAPLILAAGMRITAAVTSRTAELAASVPGAQALGRIEELLARDDVDLVVIVTPNDLHVPQALLALNAGKHVVVDKPLCLHASDADALIALATQRQLQLAVFHNRRWDSDFLTLRKLLSDERLGEVVTFSARWDRYRPQVTERWRDQAGPGAGALFDLGSHLLDQVLQLFGRPDWIQADIVAQRRHARADDCFELLMGKGRLRISLGVSLMAADNRMRYRVLGERAAFTKAGLDPQEAQLRNGMSPLANGFGIESLADHGVLIHGDGVQETVISEAGRWLTFYEAVRDGIEHGTPMPVTAPDAAATIALIEAARRSSDTGRRIAL